MSTINYNLDAARYARRGYQGTSSTKPRASNRESIRVDARTLARLKVADRVAKSLNSMVDKGNQIPDVYASGLDTYDRVRACYRYNLNPLSSGLRAGNCDQFSKLSGDVLSALKNSGRLRGPITTMSKQATHTWKLIGDPRITSGRKCAVVDAWTNFASGHRLKDNLFWQQGGCDVESATNNSPPSLLTTNFRSMKRSEFEREFMDGEKTPSQRLHRFLVMTEYFKEQRIRGDLELWDQDHATDDNVVLTYKHDNQRISFDADLTDSVRETKANKRAAKHWLD